MATTFYWFTFADGYSVAVRGLSASEKKRLEMQHGKLLSKVPA
jgi:hypothetical protein